MQIFSVSRLENCLQECDDHPELISLVSESEEEREREEISNEHVA